METQVTEPIKAQTNGVNYPEVETLHIVVTAANKYTHNGRERLELFGRRARQEEGKSSNVTIIVTNPKYIPNKDELVVCSADCQIAGRTQYLDKDGAPKWHVKTRYQTIEVYPAGAALDINEVISHDNSEVSAFFATTIGRMLYGQRALSQPKTSEGKENDPIPAETPEETKTPKDKANK